MCRWYHKYKEALRLYELRLAVKQFDENHLADDMGTSELTKENQHLIGAYLTVVGPFEKASKTRGGQHLPGHLHGGPYAESGDTDSLTTLFV